MKILVIGATGFVGSYAAQHLAVQGHEVLGTCRSAEGGVQVSALGATPVMVDLEQIDEICTLVREADATVYAAQLLLEPEHQTVTAMLDALEGTGKTFLFTSGSGVVSQKTDGAWSEDTFAEDDPFVPSRWLVRRTETEKAVRDAASRNIRAMVVRPPMIWGNGRCGLIRAFHASAVTDGVVSYVGSGLNLYSNVHVEDLAELYRLAIERGTAGALYHCVAGEVSHRALAEKVAAVRNIASRGVDFAEAERLWGRFFALIIMSTCSRTRSPRARTELGWQPRHLDMLSDVGHPAYLETAG